MAFVVFEGIDGSGKTTLIQRLSSHLKQMGREFVLTREPGGSRLGDQIRALLLDPHGDAPTPRTELLLYEAVRAQHVDTLIRPALEVGKWVICDRFTASTVAFQADARGLDASDVDMLNRYATGGLQPDLTVLLDLDPVEGQKRREQRTQKTGEEADRFEREKMEFHQKVRQSYLRQSRENANWLVLDASLAPDAIAQNLFAHLGALKWPGF